MTRQDIPRADLTKIFNAHTFNEDFSSAGDSGCLCGVIYANQEGNDGERDTHRIHQAKVISNFLNAYTFTGLSEEDILYVLRKHSREYAGSAYCQVETCEDEIFSISEHRANLLYAMICDSMAIVLPTEDEKKRMIAEIANWPLGDGEEAFTLGRFYATEVVDALIAFNFGREE